MTLGGTGKENGDRHPKIGNHVNLGAGSTVLGESMSVYICTLYSVIAYLLHAYTTASTNIYNSYTSIHLH